VAWLLTVLVLSVAGTADAQRSADVTEANAYFQRGLALLKAKNYVEASEALEHSQKLNPGWGTVFNLALCYRLSGKLASAWAAYRDVAQHDVTPKNRERRNEADRQAKELEPRLSRLLLVANHPPDGLVVRLDGVDVTGLLGTENPVDNGEHKLHASAPSHDDLDSTATISGEGKTVTVSIELIRTQASVAPSDHPPPVDGGHPIAPPGDSGGGTPPIKEVDTETPRSRRATYGVIVAASGGALFATGLVFGQLASSKWSAAQDECPERICSNADALNHGLVRGARARADISTALLIGGTAAIGIGVVLFISAPGRGTRARSTALRIAPRASADAVSLTLDGRF